MRETSVAAAGRRRRLERVARGFQEKRVEFLVKRETGESKKKNDDFKGRDAERLIVIFLHP